MSDLTIRPTTMEGLTKAVITTQMAMIMEVSQPTVALLMDGKVRHPDPYTEIRYTAVGGPSGWVSAVSMALAVVTLVTLIGSFEGWTAPLVGAWYSYEVYGIPVTVYAIFTFIGWAFAAGSRGDPIELEREVRYLGGTADAFASLWTADYHCAICDGPLVAATGGLRCRECGRAHTYTGEIRQ